MQFSSFQEFIQMGGYAFNVWSVYGMFAVFLAVNLLGPLRRNKQIIRELKRRYELNAPAQSGTSSANSSAESVGDSQ
tara:strand:- start:207 stop:437 length:231 start_codon:yes stop_codon:yes gene_type:complete